MWFTALLGSRTLWLAVALALAGAGGFYEGDGFGYRRGHTKGVEDGYDKGKADGKHEVQLQFDLFKEQALERAMAAQAERAQEEQRLKAINAHQKENYDALIHATATAVGAVDADRLRLLSDIAASRGSSAPVDPATGLPTDATPQERVLAECINRRAEVAEDAERLSNQVTGLQSFISGVCLGGK
jgi:hypothetical protein